MEPARVPYKDPRTMRVCIYLPYTHQNQQVNLAEIQEQV